MDPLVLFAPNDSIETAVKECIHKAGPIGHILNLGHGVVQGTPEENVALFCSLAWESGSLVEQGTLV